MGLHSEYYLTISIAVMSVIITIITSIATIYLMLHFYGSRKKDIIIRKLRNHEPSKSKSNKSTHLNKGKCASSNKQQNSDGPVTNTTSPTKSISKTKSLTSHPSDSNITNNKDKDIGSYFKFTASVTLIFGALNAFFNSWYCIWLLFDPEYDDPMFYVQHPSHHHRITSTGINMHIYPIYNLCYVMISIHFCYGQCP